MNVSYLLIAFDVMKPMEPKEAGCTYMTELEWKAMQQTDTIQTVKFGDFKQEYMVTGRRSFFIPDMINAKYVLVIDVKKIN